MSRFRYMFEHWYFHLISSFSLIVLDLILFSLINHGVCDFRRRISLRSNREDEKERRRDLSNRAAAVRRDRAAQLRSRSSRLEIGCLARYVRYVRYVMCQGT